MRDLILYRSKGRSLLGTFESGSTLKAFLRHFYPEDFPSDPTPPANPYPRFNACKAYLETIIICLNHYITLRGCYDPFNCEIVVCDPPLAEAVGRAVFHYADMRKIVKGQMNHIRVQRNKDLLVELKAAWSLGGEPLDIAVEASRIHHLVPLKAREKVFISADLVAILHAVGEKVRPDGLQSYSILGWALAKYLNRSRVRHPSGFLDEKIFEVEETPLRILKGVSYIHLSQLQAVIDANCLRRPAV